MFCFSLLLSEMKSKTPGVLKWSEAEDIKTDLQKKSLRTKGGASDGGPPIFKSAEA